MHRDGGSGDSSVNAAWAARYVATAIATRRTPLLREPCLRHRRCLRGAF